MIAPVFEFLLEFDGNRTEGIKGNFRKKTAKPRFGHDIQRLKNHIRFAKSFAIILRFGGRHHDHHTQRPIFYQFAVNISMKKILRANTVVYGEKKSFLSH